MATKILKLPAVCERTALSRSSVYLKIADGTFPRPIKLGGSRAVGWVESEIQEWIEKQVAAARGTAR